MRRTSLSAAAVLLWVAGFPGAAQSGEPYIDPNSLGVQAHAKATDGRIVVSRTQTTTVCETQYRTETRSKLVEVDGEKREVRSEVTVPVTVCKPVTSTIEHTISVDTAQAFDMQGRRIEAPRLADALAEGTTILLAGRKVPRYYLTIYKPDTVLLVVEPQNTVAPLPPAGVPIVPPAAASAPAPAAPPKPAAVLPMPATVATVAPAAAAPFGVPNFEPQVRMARIVDDRLGLRSYVKDVSQETASGEQDVDGVKKLVTIQVEVESITDVERKYPLGLIKFSRVDKKALTDDETAKLKESERCVLVSADGKEIDARWLKIVKPDVLIIVAPLTQSPLQVAPAALPPPLPLPVPMPPDP